MSHSYPDGTTMAPVKTNLICTLPLSSHGWQEEPLIENLLPYPRKRIDIDITISRFLCKYPSISHPIHPHSTFLSDI